MQFSTLHMVTGFLITSVYAISPHEAANKSGISSDPSFPDLLRAFKTEALQQATILQPQISDRRLWPGYGSASEIKDALKLQIEIFNFLMVYRLRFLAPCLNVVNFHTDSNKVSSMVSKTLDMENHCTETSEVNAASWIMDRCRDRCKPWPFRTCGFGAAEFNHLDHGGDGGWMNWAYAGDYTTSNVTRKEKVSFNEIEADKCPRNGNGRLILATPDFSKIPLTIPDDMNDSLVNVIIRYRKQYGGQPPPNTTHATNPEDRVASAPDRKPALAGVAVFIAAAVILVI